jgi:hypothetical protein
MEPFYFCVCNICVWLAFQFIRYLHSFVCTRAGRQGSTFSIVTRLCAGQPEFDF